MEDNLELVATTDLLTELKKRYDQMLFIGYKNSSNSRTDYHCASNAELHQIYGLAQIAAEIAKESCNGNE